MSYCTPSDLLVGDMPISAQMADRFIQAAADEIDSKLGVQFVLPIPGDADASVELFLKRVNVLIATGRLVMAQAVGNEDNNTHAYGSYLLREGSELLGQILCGEIALIGVPKRDEYLTSGNGPSVINEDGESAFTMFYNTTMRGQPSYWRPGAVA